MSETQQELERRVRRDAVVDARLDNLEAHAANLNGQIARGADAIERVEQAVASIKTDLAVKDAETKARQNETNKALRRGISKRETMLGVALVVFYLATILLHFV